METRTVAEVLYAKTKTKLDLPSSKPVKVRITETDNLGPAPVPDGYFEYLATKNNDKPIIKLPTFVIDSKRKLVESKEYVAPSKKTTKVALRQGGGQVWEDPTLAFWDENDYRIFVGDLGKEVTDDMLSRAFSHYPSLQRTQIVRDKRSGRTKGYGFISFSDANDFVNALRDMQGKYVGNRPLTLKRSTWKDRIAPTQ